MAILNHGQVIAAGKTEDLRERVRRFYFQPADLGALHQMAGVLDLTRQGETAVVTLENCDENQRAALKAVSGNGLRESALNLDEIFEAYIIGNRGAQIERKILEVAWSAKT